MADDHDQGEPASDEVDRDAPTLVGQDSGPHTPVAEAELASSTPGRSGDRLASSAVSSSSNDLTISLPEDERGARRRLGDFELVRKIGQGGMGEVWLANQVSLDRNVAVKVLPRTLASQENFIERFQREAKAAASLVHPNVIQIYAYGIDEGTPYFAMEYVEGEDLQQRMRSVQQLDVREIVEVMLGVGAALRAAHEKGLIHRDIKPSNVMIDRNGVVKVMDFGLAKATSGGSKSLTHAGLIMGTPNYLSPEQGRGDPLDGRSDLYSLGVVMYELLTGTLPFRADTPAGLIFKHVYEPPPSPQEIRPDVPPFLVEVTLKLLEKDPDDRYKDAAEFMADLGEFLDNWDHYMEGGDRRPDSGYLDADRVARSGLASVGASGIQRKASSERRRSVQEVKNAVTEGVERKASRGEKAPARPAARRRQVEEQAEEETADAEALEREERRREERSREERSREERSREEREEARAAAAALPPPFHQSRKFERPPKPAPKPSRAPWAVAALLVVAGGGYGLHRTRPDLTAPLLAGLGVNAAVGSQQPSSWSSGGGIAFLYSRALPTHVTVLLRSPTTTYTIKPGTRESYPEGTYDLVLERRGYEPCTFRGLTLLREGEEGVLTDVNGRDAMELPLAWIPSEVLQGHYKRGRELLEQGELERAADQLRSAVDLDPSFSADGGPTVLELLEQAGQAKGSRGDLSDGQLLAALERARGHLEARRWQAALAELETKGLAERQADTWKDLHGRAQDGVARGEALVADLEGEISRGRFGEAAERMAKLVAEDPENPDRGRLSERLATGQQERDRAMDPAQPLEAARTRLQDYLARWGSEDAQAKLRLQTVEAELTARDQRRKLAEELERLRQAGDWEQVLTVAEELLVKDPQHELGLQARREARRELKRGEIVAAFAALDAALQGGDADRLAALMDLSSPECQRELACFRRFLAGQVSGRFPETQHLLPAERIELDELGRQATVRTEWVFKVGVLDQAPRQLRLMQEVRLRHDGSRWLFTGFRVPEGEKPSAPH